MNMAISWYEAHFQIHPNPSRLHFFVRDFDQTARYTGMGGESGGVLGMMEVPNGRSVSPPEAASEVEHVETWGIFTNYLGDTMGYYWR